jgi:hypothetical protein
MNRARALANSHELRDLTAGCHYRRQKRAGLIELMIAVFFSYAIGKLVNGFIADHANVVRYMSLGLLLSAGMNLMMGMTSNAMLLAIFWGINGWAQSMGVGPAWYRWRAGTAVKSEAPFTPSGRRRITSAKR